MEALLTRTVVEGDPVRAWLEDHVIGDPDAFTSTEELFKDHKQWCADSMHKTRSISTFSESLNKIVGGKGKKRIDGIPTNGYRGLRIKTEEDRKCEPDGEEGFRWIKSA